MFSGIGGFELGIKQIYEQKNSGVVYKSRQMGALSRGQKAFNGAGMGYTNAEQPSYEPDKSGSVCIGYSEIDKHAIKIYEQHFPGHRNFGDATTINANGLSDFDLLVGGFPCQSFSVAGKRRGFEDTRGTLFFDIARILRAKQPTNFVLENVKGLLSHDSGKTFRTIIATLTKLGYDVEWQVLNSKNFGVPQNRERVFIVGHLRGKSRPKVFPFREADRTTDEGLKSDNTEGEVAQTIRTRYGNGSGSHVCSPDEINIRRLTPVECERLQGFPDQWTNGLSDMQRYKTLGNAVTVNVVQALLSKLLYANHYHN